MEMKGVTVESDIRNKLFNDNILLLDILHWISAEHLPSHAELINIQMLLSLARNFSYL